MLGAIASRDVDPAVLVTGGTVTGQMPFETCAIRGRPRIFDVAMRREVVARSEDVEGTASAFGVRTEREIGSTGRAIDAAAAERALAVAVAVSAAQAAGLPHDSAVEPSVGDDVTILMADRPDADVFIGKGPAVGESRLHGAVYDLDDAILVPAILGPAISAVVELTKSALRGAP